MAQHTDRRYEEELTRLRQLVLAMGGLVESQIAELAAERKALRLRLRIEVPFVLPIPDPGLLVPLEREAPPALVHQQPAWLVHQQPAAWLAQPGLPARTRSRC